MKTERVSLAMGNNRPERKPCISCIFIHKAMGEEKVRRNGRRLRRRWSIAVGHHIKGNTGAIRAAYKKKREKSVRVRKLARASCSGNSNTTDMVINIHISHFKVKSNKLNYHIKLPKNGPQFTPCFSAPIRTCRKTIHQHKSKSRPTPIAPPSPIQTKILANTNANANANVSVNVNVSAESGERKWPSQRAKAKETQHNTVENKAATKAIRGKAGKTQARSTSSSSTIALSFETLSPVKVIRLFWHAYKHSARDIFVDVGMHTSFRDLSIKVDRFSEL